MNHGLEYAIETLRLEYYRLVSQVRAVPCEAYGAGFSGDIQREQQRQIVDAITTLGGDLTDDMRMLQESFQ